MLYARHGEFDTFLGRLIVLVFQVVYFLKLLLLVPCELEDLPGRLGIENDLRGVVSPGIDGRDARKQYLACLFVVVGSLRLSPLAWTR